MTFYLIGLGLDKNSISADAVETLKKCDKIYLENYTVKFPYSLDELGFDFELVNREFVESEKVLSNAKDKTIALLVYGDALSATTHTHLILSCKKQGIEYKIFHNSSIMTAVAETGLSLYKFGKVASLPNWKEHKNKPKSFMDYLKENKKIEAHTLILADIGLNFERAIEQLKESGFDMKEKIVILSNAGLNSQKIFYETPEKIKKVHEPYCIIVPGKMGEYEESALKELKN